ncbi:hypothetical protein ACFE04_022022 [Oxalis oulophora]
MRDILVSVCNGAVETLVKTSHQVLTTDPNERESVTREKKLNNNFFQRVLTKEAYLVKGKQNGWVEKVSSTLAVPTLAGNLSCMNIWSIMQRRRIFTQVNITVAFTNHQQIESKFKNIHMSSE